MATQKKAAGKSTSLVKWNEKFSKYAQETKEQVKNIGVAGVGVKFGRGSMTVGDKQIAGGKLECVIVGACALNAWYATDYNPDDKQPPDCYAFSVIANDPDMAPLSVPVEKRQSDKCETCEKNQFGTAKTGRGKACGNNMRLGLILATDAKDGKGVASAELATAKISPTNLKNYANYVKLLEDEHHRPIWSVITQVASYNDDKTQIRVEFKMVDPIDDDDTLLALEKRYIKVQETLQQPFAAPAPKSPLAKGSKPAGGTKKFAAGAAKGRR